MNKRNTKEFILFFFFILFQFATTQVNSQFNVEDYEQFLKSNENLTADGLLSQYPSGRFLENAQVDLSRALYWEEIDEQYALTAVEKSLLQKHGFVVTERLSHESFGQAFLEIYHKDLPVFVSTDAILHALHMSYDAILIDVERSILIPKLDKFLATLHAQVPMLAERYASEPLLLPMLKDIDVYLTVPRILLGQPVSPVYPENQGTVKELLNYIQAQQPGGYKLFSSTLRDIDFSQFTPRGHYTQSPELTNYFQAMMWLGRIEFYLFAPKSDGPKQTEADIQRQTIDAVLLAEAAEAGDAFALLEEIDNTLRFMVGESDNVTLKHIRMLMDETHIKDASQLLSAPVWKDFQATLLKKAYASQRILSQILCSNPMNPEQIEPASAFLLIGQRFVIDSFITGNVVYDKIIFNGAKVLRMLPSSLDALFALGNNAAAQLLEPELQQYHYAPNLASLRRLIDSYEPEFWSDSLYNGWLNAIRTLNPPQEREIYPSFMQTAAWWQGKMNTQLAAWAQLRHDNLLYAKQSYTGGVVCSYPESLVEPIPEFYDAVKYFAEDAARNFQNVTFEKIWTKDRIINYFNEMGKIADTLAMIARKELDKTPLLPAEKDFLQKMLFDAKECGRICDGWYAQLFYNGDKDVIKQDLVVADVHTSPTDEVGTPVGYIMHAGTGPINLAVLVCDIHSDQPLAFIGPVMSYYERITVNFKRLTDEEWQIEYATTPSYRPAFVNLYLADKDGNKARGESISLFTRTDTPPADVQPRGKLILPLGQIKQNALFQNYPNPSNPETWIPYNLATDAIVTITIYNAQGQQIRALTIGAQPAGLYLTKDKAVYWDGRNDEGELAASGVYFYQLQVGDFSAIKKMIILK